MLKPPGIRHAKTELKKHFPMRIAEKADPESGLQAVIGDGWQPLGLTWEMSDTLQPGS